MFRAGCHPVGERMRRAACAAEAAFLVDQVAHLRTRLPIVPPGWAIVMLRASCMAWHTLIGRRSCRASLLLGAGQVSMPLWDGGSL